MPQLENGDGDAASLRRAVAGAAHDLNNLLLVVAGCAELALGDDGVPESTRQLVRQILEATDRARSLSERCLFLDRQPGPVTPVDVSAVLKSSEGLLTRLVGDAVTVRVDSGAGPLWVEAQPSQLEQVIFNLVLNARDAMPRGGTVTITATLGGPHVMRLRVTDTGSGIDPTIRERMFEPYVTTKAGGKGVGLGLAVVQAVVRQLGGSIEVTSSTGQGSSFVVDLPIATFGSAASSRPS